MHATGHLTGREQPGHRRRRGVGIDPHAAHHVVTRRSDLHGPGGDVDAGELHELVVHRGEPAADVLGAAAGGNVEEHTTVGAAPAGLDLRVDGPGHFVTWEQVRRPAVVGVVVVPGVSLFFGLSGFGPEHVRHVIEHEAGAF